MASDGTLLLVSASPEPPSTVTDSEVATRAVQCIGPFTHIQTDSQSASITQVQLLSSQIMPETDENRKIKVVGGFLPVGA